MATYLLDTNVCGFLFRNKYGVADKLAKIGLTNCAVSQLTVAELMVGIEYTLQKTGSNQYPRLKEFLKYVPVISIDEVLSIAAKEKARLQLAGTPNNDLIDVLIAATAMKHNLILVTENVKHFTNFKSLTIENWVDRNA